MTPELTLLGWTLVLAIVQILLPGMLRTSETGVDYNASDSTITSAEINSGVTITGTSSTTSGTVSVSVTDGTTTVNATPTTNGTWSMTLTKAQVQAFKNGTLTITATVTVSGDTATSMYVPQLLLVTGTPTITVNGEQLVGPNNTLPTAELLTQTVEKAAG